MSNRPAPCNTPLTERQLRQYQTQGFLILKGILKPQELEAMRTECMQVWKKEKGEFDPDGTWLHNALLGNIHHHSPCAREYYFNGPLVDVVQQLIGPNIKGATTQLTFKMRGNTMPFGWHQDNGYGQLDPENAITTLTALDDTDEENGCLWVLPESHRQGQIDVSARLSNESKAAGTDLSVEVEDPAEAIPVSLQAGDAILLHCHLLHRSEGNRSRSRDRRILFMRYADADAVEVYNARQPRLGPLLRGNTRFPEVKNFERELFDRQD